MASPQLEPSDWTSQEVYPQPDPDTVAAINEKLAEVVSLLHGGRLSEAQRNEIAGAIALQTANAAKLHDFRLRNANEPAFIAQLISGD